MTRDLRTLIYLLNLELREECSRSGHCIIGWNPASNRGAADEAGAIGDQQLEAEAKGGRGAAVEADAAMGPGSSS